MKPIKEDPFYSKHPEFDRDDGVIGDIEGYELTKFYVTYFWFHKFHTLRNNYELEDLVNEICLKFIEKNLFNKYNPQITSKKYHVMISVRRSLIDIVRKQGREISIDRSLADEDDEDFSLLAVLDSGIDVNAEVVGNQVRDDIIAILPDYTNSKLEGNSPLLGKCGFTLRNIALHLEQGYGANEIAEFYYNPSSGRHTTTSNVLKMVRTIRQICVDYGYAPKSYMA